MSTPYYGYGSTVYTCPACGAIVERSEFYTKFCSVEGYCSDTRRDVTLVKLGPLRYRKDS